jgi:hypothetical protein
MIIVWVPENGEGTLWCGADARVRAPIMLVEVSYASVCLEDRYSRAAYCEKTTLFPVERHRSPLALFFCLHHAAVRINPNATTQNQKSINMPKSILYTV